MADVFGRVVQDGADKVVVVVVIIIGGAGIAEGGGSVDGGSALERGSLGASLLLLHAEHQLIFHDVCCRVDKRRHRMVTVELCIIVCRENNNSSTDETFQMYFIGVQKCVTYVHLLTKAGGDSL